MHRTTRGHHIAVAGDRRSIVPCRAATRRLATASFSIIAFEMPIALIG